MILRKNSECPIQASSVIHYCASGNVNHRQCCEQNGVAKTTAGNKCLFFCQPVSRKAF